MTTCNCIGGNPCPCRRVGLGIPTAELYASIATLERLTMERDEERGQTYDAANEIDECAASKDWRQQQDDERERRLNEALDAAKEAGVDIDHLKVLAFETGATKWALQESLKG